MFRQGGLGLSSFIAKTPSPPYYAVIFSSIKSRGDNDYYTIAQKMVELASLQPGFLEIESVKDELHQGITVSYWKSLEDIRLWKENSTHKLAKSRGKLEWYLKYKTRICLVEKEY